ncbi:hypothetical protein AVP42_00993 [Agromyces sp. NDB4Y10]|nr:hypothetical protein AVP42_00993 [Agromyces sp. NDB4Y10]
MPGRRAAARVALARGAGDRGERIGRGIRRLGVGQSIDEVRVEVSGAHVGVGEQAAEEGDVRLDAEQHGAGQRGVEPVERLVAVGAVRDHLRDHRVVVGRDPLPFADARVDADALAGGRSPSEHLARRRQEAALGALRIHARLDRVAGQAHVGLRDRERLPRRDAQLLLHEVDARDELGHGVLDLQARVHLDEEELVGRGIRHQELDGAGAEVLDAAGGVACRLPDALARRAVEQGRRRLLHHLLVSALERALALAEVDDVAVRVGEDLHLDVARGVDEALEQQGVVAERGARDAAGRGQGVLELGLVAGDLHALAAAARGRLDEQWEPDERRGVEELVVGRVRLADARHHGHAGLGDVALGPDLVAHDLERERAGTDEHDAGLGARAPEGGVLGEEAVAGVDRLRAGVEGRANDARRVEVALGCRSRADAHGLVGERDVRGARVGVGVDGDGVDAEALQRADDAHGDLAAVGDEHPVEGSGGGGGRLRHPVTS